MNKNIHFLPFKKNGLQTRSVSHVFQKPQNHQVQDVLYFKRTLMFQP